MRRPRSGLAVSLVLAATCSAADREPPPKGDGFEMQTLAYVFTELESCAELDDRLRRQYDTLLFKAPDIKRDLAEFHRDPHYAAFRRDIAARRASAPEEVVQAECGMMLQGLIRQEPH